MGRGASGGRKKSVGGKREPADYRASAAEDREKIAAVAAGDEDAFRALYEKYRRRIYALAYKFCFNREEALDLTQDVFTKL